MSKLHLVLSTEDTSYEGRLSPFIKELSHALRNNDQWLAGLDTMHWKAIEETLNSLRDDGRPITTWIPTQNPSVMDQFGFKDAEDFRARVWLWREGALQQVTEEVAQDFYGDYAVGFQHVSELLRTLGIW